MPISAHIGHVQTPPFQTQARLAQAKGFKPVKSFYDSA